jgi:hypothetical protein
VVEAERGKRLLGARAIASGDRQVEVVVWARLLAKERINAPAAVEPDRHPLSVEAVQYPEHLWGVHRGPHRASDPGGP